MLYFLTMTKWIEPALGWQSRPRSCTADNEFRCQGRT